MKANLIFSLPVIFVIAMFSSCDKNDDKEVTHEPAEYRTVIEKVSANGKIQPETDVKISAEVSGKINVIHVKEGDIVKKGDLLLTINPDLLESSVTRANASVNTAKANLANAKARLVQVAAQFVNAEKTYERNKKLYTEGVISESEMDAAESAYQTARAEKVAAEESVNGSDFSVKSAQATRKEASDNLGRTSIFAPTDGVITALQVEEGETVLGTIQMSGTELLRVSKLETMEVDVEVNESDIVRVAMGDTAEVEVDAYLDNTFTGVVTEIANAATNTTASMSTDQVTNFSVKIRILESSYQDILAENKQMQSPFRTGMSATVDIKTSTKTRALSIPIESVTTRTDTTSEKLTYKERKERKEELEKSKEDEEPMEVVFLYKEGKAVVQAVKTGVQDNKYIEILTGLSEGQEVITGPYRTVSRDLTNGDKVVEKDSSKDEDED
jgi:HlyD family secretion protein